MSKQSNLGSAPPSPIDIDTPDGSIFGADLRDNETQYTHQWNEQQQQLINAHRNYHYEMMLFVDMLEKEGPGDKVIPKPPKAGLKSLLGDRKKESKLLFGQDLQKYLAEKIVTKDEVTCPKVSDAGLFTNLQGILEHLKSGYDLLKKQNSLCLAASLDYGEWLNMAFELYSLEKMAGKITVTWKEWLEATVGIQDSYARKLREVAIYCVNIPASDHWAFPFQRSISVESKFRSCWQLTAVWPSIGIKPTDSGLCTLTHSLPFM